MKTDSQHDVFISYAREDRRRAELVARAMLRQHWRLWWDPDINLGSRYDVEIEDAIRNSLTVVVLWSRAAIESSWVRAEADLARELGVLIPARLDAVGPPLAFRLYQTADLSDWKATMRHERFDSLMNSIAEKIGKPVIDRKPEPTPEQHTQEGLALARRGDFESAQALYKRALTVDPEYEPAIDALDQLTKAASSESAARSAVLSTAHALQGLQFGTLKWFNPTKGFGFVSPANGGPDMFLHVSSVERSSEKPELLTEGARVAYTIESARNGRIVVSGLRVIPS